MKKIYLFYREDGFYSLELVDDEDAIRNAIFNPGTLTVTDIDSNIVWTNN